MSLSSTQSRLTILVWALGTTQVIGYGTLYYAFGILAAPMAHDLDWPQEWVFGVFSAALLLGGLAAPLAGRQMDRLGAGRVMVVGSLLSALALACAAMAPGRVGFVFSIVAIELAATLVLYDAAFAALAQAAGSAAKQRITQLTLIGGFASTAFWPLTALLLEHLTWREIFLAFALLHLGICAPLHLLLARSLDWRKASAQAPAGGSAPATHHAGSLSPAARPRAFLWLAAGFSCGGFVLSAVLMHVVPMLATLGLGAAAALVGSLFGPAQVVARLVNMLFGGRLAATWLAVLSTALLPCGLALLLVSAPALPGALAFALLFGMGSGLISIVRGTVPLMLFGTADYGARLGRLTAIRVVTTAAAPFALAVLLARLGPAWALSGLVLIGLAGVVALIALARLSASAAPQPRLTPATSG